MVTADVLDADNFRVRIIAAEASAPFNHVKHPIGTNLEINWPRKLKAGQERIDFEDAAIVVDFDFFDVVTRPFPDEQGLVEIRGQFRSTDYVGLEVINRA